MKSSVEFEDLNNQGIDLAILIGLNVERKYNNFLINTLINQSSFPCDRLNGQNLLRTAL